MRVLPDAPPTEEEENTPPQKKKGCRGCLALLGICGVILLALLLGGLAWLNGPGFRYLAQKYGPDFLAEQGFTAEFELSGTLLKGPHIDSIHLTSETSPLKTLKATNLQLRYHPLALKELKIDSLTADSLTVDLDLSQSSPKPEDEEKKKSDETLREVLAKFRPAATHPEIAISDLNLHVHKGEQNFYLIQNGALKHSARSDTFELNTGTVTDFENETFQPPVAHIQWGDDEFTITQLPLAREFSVPDLIFEVEPLFIEGTILAYGSTVDITTDLKSVVTAELGPEALDLHRFLELAPATQEVTAHLSQLHLTASQLDQEFSKWAFELSLTLDQLTSRQRDLPPTRLNFLKEELELDTRLSFELPESSQEITLITDFAPETAQDPTTAWKNSSSQLTAELLSLSAFFTGITPTLNLPVPPDGWPEGRALLLATINLVEGEPAASQVSLSFNGLDWAEAHLEKGEIVVDYLDADSDIAASLTIEQSATATLSSKASFHPKSQAYQADFVVKDFEADALQPFIRLSVGDLPLAGKLSLNWEGHGSLPDRESHYGDLSLSQTRLTLQDQEPIEISLQASYRGLSQIQLSQLQVEQGDQAFTAEASWNGQQIEIPSLSLIKAERQLATGKLSLPFTLETDPKNYFTVTDNWSVTLDAEELDIPETAQLFSITLPEGLQGQLSTKIDIAGSPAEPSLAGRVNLDRFALEKLTQLPTTDVALAWNTTGKTLALNGTVQPDGRNAIIVTGSTAFEPQKWATEPNSIMDESFDLRIDAPNLRLEPFADLSPVVKRLEGNIVAQVQANGTFRTPNLTGTINLDLPKARFDIDRLRKVRQTKLQATFADNKIQITPFSTSIDGGLFDLSGTVDIADTSNPAFDLRLDVERALVWRDDNINARTDAVIFLKGTLEQARLSGELGLAESLFYKDIELLPLDVPVSIPKAPKLPSVAKRPTSQKNKDGNALPIPEPYANWTLDIRAYTADPFLIRGNLTKGEVVGELTATGRLADPKLNGELEIKDLDASLPFSSLSLDGGKVVFTPKGGFIPKLNIRAQSRIPPYEVDIFVAGAATSPEVSFVSNPPLPESEVITLLATGSTPAGLEDGDAAKNKAFQLLIEQIRKAPPGSPLHPLARFAEPLKDVEIQVGGADPFTGKPRNSVTLPLPLPNSERWFITASVDAESNTRGLVLYLLKFN